MASERAVIAGLRRLFPAPRGVEVPIGDDAAVVRNPAARSVLCCDPVVEGVHFASDAPPALVGRKAVNRNLSDLAAMGARPDWLLVSLVLPRGYAAARRRALLRGIRDAARAGGAAVVGGDLATSPGPLVVTVTAIGHPVGRVLRRDGARPGDRLHLSGPIGGAGLGHHLRFLPELAVGAWLARQRPVRAAIDVSDGLLLDLRTLLDASGCPGAELDAEALPLRRAALRRGGGDRDRALRRALAEGEDHVLLFAARAALPAGGPLPRAARRPIGRVSARPGLFLVHADGRRQRLRAEGYQHVL